MIFLLTGCNAPSNDSDKIEIYTTFYVMSEFARVIGGDHVVVTQLLSDGGDAHNYEPTSQNIANVATGDLFIYNSDQLEHYAQDIIESSGNDRLKVVMAAQGIELIQNDHGLDPHTWLSLKNAKIELKNILDAYCEIDNDNADYYQSNYDEYVQELEDLDKSYEQGLAPFVNREIVVEHEAFAYLCADYGIVQKSVTGITSEGEATANQIKSAVDYINSEQIKVIFYQEELNEKVMQTIAQETRTELLPLSTIASLSSEDVAAGSDYLSVMRQNLENIVYALDQIN